MPYQSKAQQRYFHAKLPHLAAEWDAATKHGKGGFAKLPQHVHKREVAKHWTDNLVAHHRAKLAFHQGQLSRFQLLRGRKGAVAKRSSAISKRHWSDNLVAHHQSRVAHHQAQLARLERFRSAPQRHRKSYLTAGRR